jgi:GNAT superfamily N-acetyltransferase
MQVSPMQYADDWSWVTARRQRKKRKVLAGFARATGDGALTATIHDLVVLPELQGLGLGRKLLAKATIQASCHALCLFWLQECVPVLGMFLQCTVQPALPAFRAHVMMSVHLY